MTRSFGPRGVALLVLCAAYLQGGLVKLLDFEGATAEMAQFGLEPAQLVAAAVIALELGGAVLVLSGHGRRWAALALAGFTAAASVVANPFWTIQGVERLPQMNAFFEHVSLAGAWLLVAWLDGRRV